MLLPSPVVPVPVVVLVLEVLVVLVLFKVVQVVLGLVVLERTCKYTSSGVVWITVISAKLLNTSKNKNYFKRTA